MSRQRLPNRRDAVRFAVEHDGQAYLATAGYYPDGRLAEVFLDSERPNSAIAIHANDAAVLASLLLQHGVPPEEIRHSVSGPIAKAIDGARPRGPAPDIGAALRRAEEKLKGGRP